MRDQTGASLAALGYEVNNMRNPLDRLRQRLAGVQGVMTGSPPSRSLELAISKLDEAQHWLGTSLSELKEKYHE